MGGGGVGEVEGEGRGVDEEEGGGGAHGGSADVRGGLEEERGQGDGEGDHGGGQGHVHGDGQREGRQLSAESAHRGSGAREGGQQVLPQQQTHRAAPAQHQAPDGHQAPQRHVHRHAAGGLQAVLVAEDARPRLLQHPLLHLRHAPLPFKRQISAPQCGPSQQALSQLAQWLERHLANVDVEEGCR